MLVSGRAEVRLAGIAMWDLRRRLVCLEIRRVDSGRSLRAKAANTSSTAAEEAVSDDALATRRRAEGRADRGGCTSHAAAAGIQPVSIASFFMCHFVCFVFRVYLGSHKIAWCDQRAPLTFGGFIHMVGRLAVVFAGHQVRLQAAQQPPRLFDRRFAAPVAVAARANHDFDPRLDVLARGKALRVRPLDVLLRQLQVDQERHRPIGRAAVVGRWPSVTSSCSSLSFVLTILASWSAMKPRSFCTATSIGTVVTSVASTSALAAPRLERPPAAFHFFFHHSVP